MTTKNPTFDAVLDASDPRFAEKFREAIGAQPGETVEVVTPQFKREPGRPGPGSPPSSADGWEALRAMSETALRECGLRGWDRRPDGKVLMLLPGEWYRAIPAGYRVVDIFEFEKPTPGDEPFVPGETDDDIRFGCLSYGVVVQASPREDGGGARVPSSSEGGRTP